MQKRAIRFPLVCFVMAILIAGCSSTPPQTTALMESMEVEDITKRELQTLMYRYAEHYAGQVELATDEIYLQATDAQIRKNAIQWNIHGVAEMMKNCFNGEPMVALLSAWVYAAQVREYYTTGYGQDVFGPFQSIAVETSQESEDELFRILKRMVPESQTERLVPKLSEYIEEHPIRNQRFVSQFFSENMVRAMGAPVAGGLSAAGSMNEQMVALTDRANILTALLPRQINWQTEAVLYQSEQMIGRMRDSTIVAIQEGAVDNLGPLLTFLDQQRAYVSEDLALERRAVLEALADERLAVLGFIAQERNALLETIAEVRDTTMQEMNAMTLAALQQFLAESGDAVDHSIDQVYWRTAQLLVLPFIFLAIFVIVVMFWIRSTVNRLLDSRDDRRDSQQ